jgi:hypothetical protein
VHIAARGAERSGFEEINKVATDTALSRLLKS